MTRLRIALTEWIARIAVRLLPRARAYEVLVLAARLLAGTADDISQLARGRAVSTLYAAELLRDMLGEATVAGGVDVRMTVKNEAALESLMRRHGGRFVLYTAHFYLSMAIPEVLRRHGLNPIVIAGYDGDRRRLNWFARPEPPPLIPEDALCLLKARKALALQCPISLCPDTAIAVAPGRFEVVINPNTFRFAETAGAGAIFASTQLTEDGAIEVEFALPDRSAVEKGAAAICESYRAFLEPRIGRPCRILERHEQSQAKEAAA